MLPSIERVRPVFSLTTCASSALYLLGSKVATAKAIAPTTSTTRPTIAYSVYLMNFMGEGLALSESFVGDAEGDMPGRDVPARRLGVTALVVEENVRAEGLQERPLVQAA